MYKSKILLSTIAALAIVSSNVNAESTEIGDVDVWETEVVSSSLNLGKNAIETKQADHLSDLLRDLPGVNVGGTHSINNRISIRGLQDENLDISIDGAKLSNVNMFHHIGNLMINPDILKKAEIQVGTNSVVNGSLGGSVSFDTKDGKDMLENGENFGMRLSSTYNSNKSISGSITGYGKASEDLSFLIYTNYVDRGDWKYPSGEESFGLEGKNKNILVKGTYDISDSQSISFSYDKLVDEGNYLPRPNFNTEANAQFTGDGVTFPTEYTRDTITLKYKLDLNDSVNLDTTIYSNKNKLERYETWVGRTPRPTFEGLLEGEVENTGINSKAQSNIETGNILHSLTYGALYDKQTSEVTWAGDKYGVDESAKTFALYIEDEIDFDNGFILTPGVRYNNYNFDGSYGKIKDSKFTYGLATEYAVTDNLSLLASATTLYKGVEMVDVLASNRTLMDETTNLRAETGINKEIGVRYIEDNIGFSLKYFKTNIKDSIITNWSATPPWVGTMANGGDLVLKGLEASFKYQLGDFNSLLTYSKSQSEYKETGLSTEYEPGDTLTLNLDYQVTPMVNASWNSIFVKEETDNGETEKVGYGVHNLAFNIKPNKNLTIVAGVDNIFNKEYVDHTSINGSARGIYTADSEPGRNFKVTLSYKF